MTTRTAKKTTKATKTKQPIGIPGDKFRVEQKGTQFFVLDATTGTTVAGWW
jgi:hypothetical protein